MTEAVETIAAQATPPGRGGIGIIRLSGPRSRTIAEAVFGRCPSPRQAAFGAFRDAAGAVLDHGLALFFPAPNSFTGEDVVELHGHGGPVVLDLLLARVIELGARLARPGEFSERAFLNDKLDLTQAEAIADLIDAGSAQAAKAATRALQGEFSRRIHALVDGLIALRSFIEAAIDFPDEEIEFLNGRDIARRLEALRAQLQRLIGGAQQGRLLREGMTVVIAGRPNAGKSSLLNALAGREAAIVTDLPGTTRDVLREHLVIDGLPLHVLDTAGLRDSVDPIEQEGVRRAWAEIERADAVLLVIDDTLGLVAADESLLQRLPSDMPTTVVHNKVDISGRAPGVLITGGAVGPMPAPCDAIALSALTGAGLDALREHLKERVGFHGVDAGGFTARRRHLEALQRAAGALERAASQLNRAHVPPHPPRQEAGIAAELLAEDLRQAQHALGEITGEFTSDDLLGSIFADFCIGK